MRIRPYSLLIAAMLLLGPRAGLMAQEAAQARPKIALVLSGGSAFGIAHVGVIKAIEEVGIPIDLVAGTSMGSIISALYASGYSPDEMESIVADIDWNTTFTDPRASAADRYDHLKRRKFPIQAGISGGGLRIGSGIFEGQNVLALFTEITAHMLAAPDFDAFPVPYRAVAADLLTGEKLVFDRGSIAEAMRSSMSIPGVFRPYEYDGRRIIDGGVVDNLPVDVAKALDADIVIAVVSRGAQPKDANSIQSAVEVAGQTFNLFIQQNMKPNEEAADILIGPDLSRFNTASYSEAPALVKQGYAGGKLAFPALEALAERLKADRGLVEPRDQPNRKAFKEPPRLDSIRVLGGTESDRAAVQAIFAPLARRDYTRAELKKAIDDSFALGRFDLVKFTMEAAPSGQSAAGGRAPDPVGIVNLIPDSTSESALLVGVELRGNYSVAPLNSVVLSSGLLLRDLVGLGSALFVEASFVDQTKAYAEWFQPFGPFFLMPFARYAWEYDTFALDETLLLTTEYRNLGAGIWAGLNIGPYADIMAGWAYESVQVFESLSKYNESLGNLKGSFRFDTRDTAVFAQRGFMTELYGRYAYPALIGQLPYYSAELDFSLNLPFGKRTTVGFSGYAATDFSGLGIIDGANPLIEARRFSMRRPGIFYGIEDRPLRGVGNHVGALAVELRQKLGELNAILGGDLFLIANCSLGAVRITGEESSDDFLPLRWNASAGLGARIDKEFGLLVSAGLVYDGDATRPYRPAIGIELGSFRIRLEDRR